VHAASSTRSPDQPAPSAKSRPPVCPEAPALSPSGFAIRKIASALAIRFGHPFLVGSIEWKPPGPSDVVPRHLPYNTPCFLTLKQRILSTTKSSLPFGEYEPFPLIHRVVTSVSSTWRFPQKEQVRVGQLPCGKTSASYLLRSHLSGEVRRFAAGGAQLSSTFQMMAVRPFRRRPNSICEWSAFAAGKRRWMCAHEQRLHVPMNLTAHLPAFSDVRPRRSSVRLSHRQTITLDYRPCSLRSSSPSFRISEPILLS